jgi:hypothetical protein
MRRVFKLKPQDGVSYLVPVVKRGNAYGKEIPLPLLLVSVGKGFHTVAANVFFAFFQKLAAKDAARRKNEIQ